MDRVAVVVLNWNGAALLESCISSLIAQDYVEKKIFLIDNGSTDNSRTVLEKLAKQYPDELEVIYHGRNSGFAGGVNIGVRRAIAENYDAVALFNNDAVARPNWLDELADVLNEKTDVGIATGLLLHQDGQTIDSTGDFYSIWGLAFPRHRDETSERAPDSGYVFGATGGASLFRVEMLRQTGLFDEDFFAYYEDVDLSFRAQLMGWKVYYTKAAVAFHKRGETSRKLPGFSQYQMFKNLPQLFWKNVPAGLLFAVGWRFKIAYFLIFFSTIIRGYQVAAIKGLTAGLWFACKAILKRAEVQAKRKVSAREISQILYPDLLPTQKRRLQKLFGFGARRT